MDIVDKNKKAIAYVSPVKNKQSQEEIMANNMLFSDCYNTLSEHMNFGAKMPSISSSLGKGSIDFLSNSTTKQYKSFNKGNLNQENNETLGSSLHGNHTVSYTNVLENTKSASKQNSNHSFPSLPLGNHSTSSLPSGDKWEVNSSLPCTEYIIYMSTTYNSISDYFEKLAVDIEEEEKGCSVEDIKKRSRDRQVLIRKCLKQLAEPENQCEDTVQPSFKPGLSSFKSEELEIGKKLEIVSGHSVGNNLQFSMSDCEDTVEDQQVHPFQIKNPIQYAYENFSNTGLYVNLNPIRTNQECSAADINISETDSFRKDQNMAQKILNNDNSCLVIIDGTDVALGHGKKKIFSCRGIELCVNYFVKKGHRQVYAVVPQWRLSYPTADSPISDQHLLLSLFDRGHLQYIPSKKVGGKRIIHQEDRVILKLAAQSQGVIVSNKHYNNLWEEVEEWREIIEKRVLMYKFVGDILLIPEDPLGRDGPRLDDFLTISQSPAENQLLSDIASKERFKHGSPKGGRKCFDRSSPASRRMVGSPQEIFHVGEFGSHLLNDRRALSPSEHYSVRTYSPQCSAAKYVMGGQRQRRLSSPTLSSMRHEESNNADVYRHLWVNNYNINEKRQPAIVMWE